MEYRKIGGTDLVASVMGFGCNRISHVDGTRDRAEVEATLRAGLDAGINLFDTADIYAQGASERLLGSVLRGQRDRVLLCTKAGCTFGGGRRVVRHLRPYARRLLGRWQPARQLASRAGSSISGAASNFTPHYITSAIEQSLRRLKTDYIDLFLLHNPEAETARQGPLFEALDRVKGRGLIRHWGASISGHATSAVAHAFLDVPGLAALQVLVNPLKAVHLASLAPLAAARNVALISRQPFHKGAVFTDRRFLEAAAAHPAYSPAQLAVRYALQQQGIGVVLAGMTTRAHLEEGLGALAGPPLGEDEVRRLGAMSHIV